MVSYARCDGCFRSSYHSQYWLKLTCDETFYVHLVVLKRFYYKPKKLGSSKTWIPTIIDDHILDSQWNLMPNGLWTNPWIWTPCPSFGKSCFVVYLSWWVHESGKTGGGSYYGICERRFFFFNPNFREIKISKEVMWTFRFGGLNVCTTFLHGWQFSLCQCHYSLKVPRKRGKVFWLELRQFQIIIW